MSTAIGRLTDAGYVDTVGAASRRRYDETFSVPAGLAALESLYAQRDGRSPSDERRRDSLGAAGSAGTNRGIGRTARPPRPPTRRRVGLAAGDPRCSCIGHHRRHRDAGPATSRPRHVGVAVAGRRNRGPQAMLAEHIEGIRLLGGIVPRQPGRERLSLLAHRTSTGSTARGQARCSRHRHRTRSGRAPDARTRTVAVHSHATGDRRRIAPRSPRRGRR